VSNFIRQGDTSNTVIGVILLVMLLVFAGPNVLPSFLSRTFPFIDEGVPCGNLAVSEDRANHQSLIGRSATDSLSISVSTSPIPLDANGTLIVFVTLTNNTIGTVPIVFDPDQVIVGDATNSSGVGILFSPQTSLQTDGFRRAPGATTFEEQDIRLLGPRQRCVHRVIFEQSQLDDIILSGNTQVQAYYRITSAGLIPAQPIGQPTPIFTDQGLAVISNGLLVSEPVTVSYNGSE